MTLKTSFFNKGIYKSTVKRYLWGSVLYFIILFIATALSILTSVDIESINKLTPNQLVSYNNLPLVLRSGYITFPVLCAIAVPTVTALLIFRFIHSKKAAVFTHSIPLTRTANFFSSLLAGFTLMFIPVILNGIILMIISLSGYSVYFGVGDCLVWIGINLFSLFTMFSVAAFSATITGNSFAMIIINILVHSFLLIIVAGFITLAEVFLYGFTNANPLFDSLVTNNVACVSFSLATSRHFRENFTLLHACKFLVISAVIYLISWVLYKKRQLENVEDVAGFKCLNHIFKYLVTFIVTIGAFAVFSYYLHEKYVSFTVIVALASLVSYFASEMLLKKTLKVLGSYKGYIGFSLVFILCICVFSLTGFFGYESYVPSKSEIKNVSVYNYYYANEEPVSDDSDIIDLALTAHNELTKPENVYKIIPNDYDTRLHIKYTLNDGREITRAYRTGHEFSRKTMTALYENTEYKMKCEEIFIDAESLLSIKLYPMEQAYSNIAENGVIKNVQLADFLKAIQTDVLELSYDELHPEFVPDIKNNQLYSVEIRYTPEEHTDSEITYEYAENSRVASYGVYIELNANYKNAINWLTQNGYISE